MVVSSIVLYISTFALGRTGVPFGIVMHHATPWLPESRSWIEVSPETESRRAGFVDAILEEAFAGGHSVDEVKHAMIQATQDQNH